MKYTKVVRVEYEFNIGETIFEGWSQFDAFLECLEKNYTFLISTCFHHSWSEVPSIKQGGSNVYDVESIEILTEEFGKIALNVRWRDIYAPSTVILRRNP